MTIEENADSPPAARRRYRSARSAQALALLIFLVNFILMPRYFASGDPWAWRAEACSIVNTGTLAINPKTVVMLGGDRGQYFDWNNRAHGWYAKYGIMNSLMFLPPVYVESAIFGAANPAKSTTMIYNIYNIVLSVLVALVLFAITARYTARTWLRWVYVLACFYATYLWFYQRLQASEIYQVLFFITAYWLLVRFATAFRAGRRHRFLLLGAWVCIAALILTRVVYVLLIPAMWLALGYELFLAPISADALPRAGAFRRLLPLLVLPPLIIFALLAWVNYTKFGSPFLLGYHQWRPEQHHLTGDWRDGVYGFLFSTRWSIFLYFPILIFAIPGVQRFVRKYPFDAIFAFSTFILSLFIIGSIPTWRGEWTYGPRYMIFILPVLSLPALVFFDQLTNHPIAPWKKWSWAGLLALVLIYSGCQQYQVNRLEFWTVHQLAYPFEDKQMNLSLFRYFNDHTEGTILADLQRHRGDLGHSQLIEQLNGGFEPHFVDQYREHVEDLLKKTNFYWWPPPAPR